MGAPEWVKRNKNKNIGRSCKVKVRFREEWEARKKAKKYGKRAYECRYCNGWHLTSSLQGEK